MTDLQEIEKFFYSDFWVSRFKKRIKEDYNPIELDIIQGVTSLLAEDTEIKLFDNDEGIRGKSNKGSTISINSNLTNPFNVIMHEFGHRQYNQKGFKTVVDLNKEIIGSAGLYIKNNEVLTKNDYLYFIDDNELRQRIIPLVKEMSDNSWSAERAYELIKDDIKDIFTKKYIVYLLDNIL